jgi:DNA-binding transcriptional LysR family regulator
METAELVAFVQAVEAKSLSRAAAVLGVPRATLGRRLARLEERLGTRLLRRTTRSLLLTDAGENFLRHARLVLDTMAGAAASVRAADNVMRGDLRVSVPPALDVSFASMVAAFAKRHPEVRVQVDASSRIVDLLREGYDVALRASSRIQPGLIARTVGRHKAIAVASPEYLAAFGVPHTVKDLRKHRCLTAFARGELPQSTWPVGRGAVHVESAFSSNDLQVLREAAVQGVGVALLPSVLVGDLLESGALVHVLQGLVEGNNHLAVVYPEREFLPFHVRAFVDALLAWAEQRDWSSKARPKPPAPLARARRARRRV